jgi:hypothetical protein
VLLRRRYELARRHRHHGSAFLCSSKCSRCKTSPGHCSCRRLTVLASFGCSGALGCSVPTGQDNYCIAVIHMAAMHPFQGTPNVASLAWEVGFQNSRQNRRYTVYTRDTTTRRLRWKIK